jgi:uncharacterized protein YgiB involved in biofilm formation
MRRRFTRSRPPLLALGTLAASGLALAACGEDPPQEVVFNSPEQCVQAGNDQQICNAEYQEAMRRHMANAPRFDGQAACEAQFGAGQCVETPGAQTAGGGVTSFFVPFLAGYAVSSAINSFTNYNDYSRYRSQYGYVPTPIYRNRSGGYVTPGIGRSGGSAGTSVGGATREVRPANVNTRTVARQGFGGSSRSFGFGG